MSLATSGGLGGGGGHTGGLVMGHQANSVGVPPPQQPNQHGDTGHGTAPPSAAVLGADLLDRQQVINLRYVKNTHHLPLVAIDLCTAEPHIALFPPKPSDPSLPEMPRLVGKMKATVCFKSTEASYKTLRKYLAKSKSYFSLQADSLTKVGEKEGAVVVERPQRWLGLRRLEDAPDFVRAQAKTATAASGGGGSNNEPAIAQEDSLEAGVVMVNSTLDGKQPQGDDFDRVVAKVRVHSSKKVLTMLPEEAVQLLLHQAQLHVAAKYHAGEQHNLEDEEVLQYPIAIALPAWAHHDAAVEAAFDATGNGGVFFQRSVCALAGALLLAPDGKPNALLERIQKVRQALAKEYARRKVEHPGAIFEDEVLLLLLGMTDEGFECTAIQVSSVQPDLTTCLFGDFKVLSNVSYQTDHGSEIMGQCLQELLTALETIAPEADGPAGIVTYGTPSEQDSIRKTWDDVKKTTSLVAPWHKVPVFPSKSDCVATGTALLGAVSHGRQSVLVEKGEGGGTKAALGIRVQNVAPAAVGVTLNYHGGAADKWTPVKTIFDFDRRIPAGPYQMEFVASECVVHREEPKLILSDEKAFLKATKEKESSKHIPERETAALNLQVQLLQKWTRAGEWKKVGDVQEPLVKTIGEANDDDDDDDDDEKKKDRIGCESVMFEVSLGITGMITTSLVGERESVVQATKTARNSAIRYYIGILLAILFFGGFLVRSYWEEYTFNRDTDKLLAYYKHVLPGSISDGDRRNAMHLVWKHRHKKRVLWKQLERKYGVPVREKHQWEGYTGPDDGDGDGASSSSEHHDETVDLDNDKDDGEDEHEEDEL